MTDEQRSLAGYKGSVHDAQDFDNPNEGKPLLDDSVEYVFKLISYPDRPNPRVITREVEKENKKTREKKKVKVDSAVCVYEEEITKNEVVSILNIDSLNFSDDDTYQSAVVKFFKKIKTPLVEGVYPVWENYFLPGMRFRGRVVVKQKKDKDGNTITNYYLDIPTCRPILPSDMHPDALATLPTNNAPKTNEAALSLANAKLIVKGCASRADALCRLYEARVSEDVVDAFKAADDAKQIAYPI